MLHRTLFPAPRGFEKSERLSNDPLARVLFRRGSAFSPPSVFIGINADAECVVQPFTSTRNRLHCIMCADSSRAEAATLPER